MKNVILLNSLLMISLYSPNLAHAAPEMQLPGSCNEVQYGAIGSATSHGVKEIAACGMNAVLNYLKAKNADVSFISIKSNYKLPMPYSIFKAYQSAQDIFNLSTANDVAYIVRGKGKFPNTSGTVAFEGTAEINYENIYKRDSNGVNQYSYTRCFVSDRRVSENEPCDVRDRSIDIGIKHDESKILMRGGNILQ